MFFCCLHVSHKSELQVGFGFTNPIPEQCSNVSVFPLCHLSLPWPLIFEADQDILIHPFRPSWFLSFQNGQFLRLEEVILESLYIASTQSKKTSEKHHGEERSQWAQSNRQQLLWAQSNFKDHPRLHCRNSGGLNWLNWAWGRRGKDVYLSD